MTPSEAANAADVADARPWTCPFCPLACDHLGVRLGGLGEAPTLTGGVCERASLALRRCAAPFPGAAATPAQVDAQPCDTATAIAAAARLLAKSRQPLLAGLGTDVAGARALYRLACATGAVCDAAAGDALMHGLRALQDRGQFTTTLAEARTRADVVVFVGGLPGALAPLTALRCGIGDAQVAQRHVVLLGPGADAARQVSELAQLAAPGVTIDSIALSGDLFSSVALLAALVAQRTVRDPPEALRALAQRLRSARYAVLVGTPARLPTHGALIVETLHAVVDQLNRTTRAAALWIGGGNGAATVNQVFTWLSGLPLRSRSGPSGLEHEPLRFDAQQLLEDGAVDALLWVASFGAQPLPARAARLPRIVLGHPVMAADALVALAEGVVFIPVATPGIGAAGHLFRTDGSVLMPLRALRDDALPSVADVLGRITHAMRALRGGAAP